MKSNIFYVICSFLLVSCEIPSQVAFENSKQKFNSLTVESIRDCTTIEDDEMSNTVTFNSENCFTPVKGLWGSFLGNARKHELFVRAFKEKGTDEVRYQLYAQLISSEWSYPYAASFLMPLPNGERKLKEINGNRIGFDVNCSEYGCTHYEHFVFYLEKEYLEVLSDNLEKLSTVSNEEKFRIFRKAQGDVDFVMNINELVGVYRIAEGYK